MSSPLRGAAALLIAILISATTCHAWSYKEHILFVRLATMRLLDDASTPAAMKDWLRDAAPDAGDIAAAEEFFMHKHVGIEPQGFFGLSHWACMPDVHAGKDPRDLKIAPFGVHERLLHYVDLELLMSGDAKREYKHDLSNRPRLQDIPRDMADPRYIQAGMLPFRVEHCYNQLVAAIKDGRLHTPTTEQQEGRAATFWAGYLSHYLADNCQPHHATIDYKSNSYFANRRKAPNIHSEVEYRMCDDDKNDFMPLRREYWPLFVEAMAKFGDPVTTPDPWQASVEVSLRSYEALPLIGLAAMKAGGQAGTPDDPQGDALPAEQFDTEAFFHYRGQYMGREMSIVEMKAIQTAWAVKRIERTLRQAWDEAQR